jgi:phosphonate transport system permease protein
VFFIGLFAWCLYDFNFAPERIWTGLQRLGRVVSFMFPPHLWETWEEWLEVFTALGETIAMAFLGTVLGLILAFPVSFLGAKNINRIFFLRQGARRGYDIIRAFETLILALIFIRASEALENTSKRPVEGVVASGGSRFQSILYGIMPQVAPVHLSIILYNFESNVRSSTILGIVGAGGIGFMLSDRISGYFWDQVWTMIFMIIAMVYIIDYCSGLIRTKVIGKWEGAH